MLGIKIRQITEMAIYILINPCISGEMNKNRQPNFLVVNTETPMSDIEGKENSSFFH